MLGAWLFVAKTTQQPLTTRTAVVVVLQAIAELASAVSCAGYMSEVQDVREFVADFDSAIGPSSATLALRWCTALPLAIVCVVAFSYTVLRCGCASDGCCGLLFAACMFCLRLPGFAGRVMFGWALPNLKEHPLGNFVFSVLAAIVVHAGLGGIVAAPFGFIHSSPHTLGDQALFARRVVTGDTVALGIDLRDVLFYAYYALRALFVCVSFLEYVVRAVVRRQLGTLLALLGRRAELLALETQLALLELLAAALGVGDHQVRIAGAGGNDNDDVVTSVGNMLAAMRAVCADRRANVEKEVRDLAASIFDLDIEPEQGRV